MHDVKASLGCNQMKLPLVSIVMSFFCLGFCVLMKFFVTGLPLDTTEEEFMELMSKYGIIMQDPDTSKQKKM